METCLRDQLRWAVRAVRRPGRCRPPGTYVLAEIVRTAADTQIRPELIHDRRRTMLSLADAVDRLGSAEHRLDALEGAVQQAQLDIETMRQDLNRLLWDVRVEASTTDTLFGGQATITVTVTDRNGDPVQGATVSFTTDWGWLDVGARRHRTRTARCPSSSSACTAETPVRLADVGILQRASQKVAAATLAGPGRGRVREGAVRAGGAGDGLAVQHARACCTTSAPICPPAAIVARPDLRTATVTVHASRARARSCAASAACRCASASGSATGCGRRSSTSRSRSPSAPGSATSCGRGSSADAFDHTVVTGKLPFTLQSIHDETQSRLKEHLFVNPQLSDADVVGSGLLAQVIAQQATAAVGARTNSAIEAQLNQFVAATDVPLDARQAATARTDIVQRSSQITAGFAQSHKQLFSVTRMGA